MTTTNAASNAMLDRLVSIHSERVQDIIKRDWLILSVLNQEQFIAASHVPDEELVFAFKYARYYLSTRPGRIIEDQLYWALKYALLIAPVMSALPLSKPFQIGFVGQFVEYSFMMFRVDGQPDPASYDINVIRGAVIMHVLGNYASLGPDYTVAREIGESWELIARHWGKLGNSDISHLHAFAKHVRDGGSVHLADGLL